MVPGVEVVMGDRTFIVPPLTLGQLRTGILTKIREHDRLLAEEGQEMESTFLRGEIILAAMRRNYPPEDLSDEDFWNRIDLGNMRHAWSVVLGTSGFTPGEVTAAAIQTGT